jgi:hypothetical protein
MYKFFFFAKLPFSFRKHMMTSEEKKKKEKGSSIVNKGQQPEGRHMGSSKCVGIEEGGVVLKSGTQRRRRVCSIIDGCAVS